jgi:hypothetical protein
MSLQSRLRDPLDLSGPIPVDPMIYWGEAILTRLICRFQALRNDFFIL